MNFYDIFMGYILIFYSNVSYIFLQGRLSSNFRVFKFDII